MRRPRPAGARRNAAIVAMVVLAAVAAAPVTGQDPSASPDAPGGGSVISLGAFDEVFSDDFTTTDEWGLEDTDEAQIAGEDGGLRFRLRTDDQSRWSWHTLDAAAPVIRVGVTATLDPGSASAGPMCGSAGRDPSFFTGVVNNAGEWVLARVEGSETTVIARETIEDLSPGGGPPVRIELECAVTGAGGDRVAMFVDGINVADVTDSSTFGPFDKAGLYASVATAPFEVLFDDVLVLTGEAYDPIVVEGPAPTDGPSPAPSDAPLGALTTLGADTEIFTDGFEEEDWNTSDTDRGSIAYADEQLRFIIRPSDNALWSWLIFTDPAVVLAIEVDVILGVGEGMAGPMCGSDAAEDERFLTARIATSDEVVIGRVDGNEISTIATLDAPDDVDLDEGGRVRVRMECAQLPGGGDRVAMWLDDRLVADVTTDESIGPFRLTGLMGEGEDRRWRVSFDDFEVASGGVYAPDDAAVPTPSPAPVDTPAPTLPPRTPLPIGSLIDAVPEEFRDRCRSVAADAASGQLEAILCVPAGTATAAEYYRYESIEALGEAFDGFILRSGASPDGDDCEVEPSVVEYTIGGAPAGRLACYPAGRGDDVTFQWSSDALLVLSFGTAESHADGFSWWQNAGPVP